MTNHETAKYASACTFIFRESADHVRFFPMMLENFHFLRVLPALELLGDVVLAEFAQLGRLNFLSNADELFLQRVLAGSVQHLHLDWCRIRTPDDKDEFFSGSRIAKFVFEVEDGVAADFVGQLMNEILVRGRVDGLFHFNHLFVVTDLHLDVAVLFTDLDLLKFRHNVVSNGDTGQRRHFADTSAT